MIAMAFYIAGLIILVPIALLIIVGTIRLLFMPGFWLTVAAIVGLIWIANS